MSKMDRIGNAVRDRTSQEPPTEELLNRRESSLNLAVLAQQRMAELDAAHASDDELDNVRSLVVKLNEIASRPENATTPFPSINADERRELVPLMGKYKQGADAIRAGEGFLPDEDLETIVRIMALHPSQSEMAGVLALDDTRAKDRVARAFKVYAFSDPESYANILNNLATGRNFVRADWKTLSKLFTQTERFGISKAEVVNALDSDNWRDELLAAIEARMQGRSPGLIARFKADWSQERLIGLTPYVEEYRRHAADRLRFTAELDNALRTVFMESGVAGAVLTQEALQPNAPAESVQAYNALQKTRTDVTALMNDKNAFDRSLQSRFSSDPRWPLRATNPAVADELAGEWLDDQYRSGLERATQAGATGSFWSRMLVGIISSLFGTAYNGADIGKVSQRLQSI